MKKHYDYDYSALLGRMRSQKITQEELARHISLNPSTLNHKLNSKSEFTQSEILHIAHALDISYEDIPIYFFQLI